jgi:hypothetical protein
LLAANAWEEYVKGHWIARARTKLTDVARGGLFAGMLAAAASSAAAEEAIPSLLGTWSGDNLTISDKKGYRTWRKTIHITEQQDRRFRGHFTYSDGRKDFFGVIFPDNVTFAWVASDSRGTNQGRILGPNRISACYIEPWEEATAGCADMMRHE